MTFYKMNTQRILHTADHISTWVGKAAAWLIVALMLVVCAEVFKRYILNMPTRRPHLRRHSNSRSRS